jgi:tRNA-specific adenosine deaminase 1
MNPFDNDPDSLALLVLEQYSSLRFQLPPQQYTILAGFVLARFSSKIYKIISIGTGSKCLPVTRLSPLGDSLNDSHAEVLARRGAVRWFLEEVQRVCSAELGYESQWITRIDNGRYRLRDSVTMHMYISTLPCKRRQLYCLVNNSSATHSYLQVVMHQPDSSRSIKMSR